MDTRTSRRNGTLLAVGVAEEWAGALMVGLDIFEKINDAEDNNPNEIDEVPVKAGGLDIDGVAFVELNFAFCPA